MMMGWRWRIMGRGLDMCFECWEVGGGCNLLQRWVIEISQKSV